MGPDFDAFALPFLPPQERKKKMKTLLRKINDIPYSLVEEFFTVGPPDKCINDIEKYIEAGAKYILLAPMTPYNRLPEVLKFLVEKVISHFII